MAYTVGLLPYQVIKLYVYKKNVRMQSSNNMNIKLDRSSLEVPTEDNQ